ncbi:MAG: ABC transporter permease subunit, partial [Candidatus Latescibacteria bacterium]|nr:ABC transporter permease subunit [Candidatus Latescibacterota bacterium]NIM22538.1 ABC transporter permease subunit [Candidatus Latescibacterota bacterium]NIM65784.1 ABC transporter permease subunit [Candidatus Latescibacterota bacterium]NIO02279.1 ABC transporter permease subunit [Candidatus Latescibacterota bacterium]NIO29147.1 ABC transporter permease subunit [Candidatus Latescibacterota bacterium]
YSRHLQNTIYPLIVILYAMPKSALAPLMVIWIGYGMLSKMAISFLVAFFPIVVNTVVGLREVEPELLDLARINRASQLDVFTKIRLPNSLPYMFAGIKVALILSVTGAIVAEFVAANEGLGYLILQALYSLDTALTLVILLILALLSLALFLTVQLLQKKIAPWSAEVRQVEGSF